MHNLQKNTLMRCLDCKIIKTKELICKIFKTNDLAGVFVPRGHNPGARGFCLFYVYFTMRVKLLDGLRAGQFEIRVSELAQNVTSGTSSREGYIAGRNFRFGDNPDRTPF
jgi:hypothetical protein